MNYQTAADWFGLDIGEFKAGQPPEEKSGDDENDSSRASRRGRRWIGIGEFDSPATRAGLADTDEVLAINNQRVTNVETSLQEFKVGDPINVLIARNGELQEILLVVEARPAARTWGLKVSKKADDEQTQRLANWLNQKIDADEDESEEPEDDLENAEGDKTDEAETQGETGSDG
ncbi:MAG: hypothetical protein R3C03_20525 [Pirellulaceae bacterium]